jgi:hypothetical protein
MPRWSAVVLQVGRQLQCIPTLSPVFVCMTATGGILGRMVPLMDCVNHNSSSETRAKNAYHGASNRFGVVYDADVPYKKVWALAKTVTPVHVLGYNARCCQMLLPVVKVLYSLLTSRELAW